MLVLRAEVEGDDPPPPERVRLLCDAAAHVAREERAQALAQIAEGRGARYCRAAGWPVVVAYTAEAWDAAVAGRRLP